MVAVAVVVVVKSRMWHAATSVTHPAYCCFFLCPIMIDFFFSVESSCDWGRKETSQLRGLADQVPSSGLTLSRTLMVFATPIFPVRSISVRRCSIISSRGLSSSLGS
jgi:hypothetical protein